MKKFSATALTLLKELNDVKSMATSKPHAFIVGGAVRDYLLGRDFNDEDIATDLKDTDVIQDLGGNIVYPGTVNVYRDNRLFEITTFRVESHYADGRHPSEMHYTPSWQEDAQRRDFTINALYYDGTNIYDAVGGLDDLKHQTLRFIGEPLRRCREDRLRILRALRLSSVLGFNLEKMSSEALFEFTDLVSALSYERILNEYLGLFSGKDSEKVYHNYFKIFQSINPNALDEDGYLLYNALYECQAFSVNKHTQRLFNWINEYRLKPWDLNTFCELIVKINHNDDLICVIKGLHHEDYLCQYYYLPLCLNELDFNGAYLKKLSIHPSQYKDIYCDILQELALKKIANNQDDILNYLEKYKNIKYIIIS